MSRPAFLRRLAVVTALAVVGGCGAPRRAALVEGAAVPRPIEGTVSVLTTLTGKKCRNAGECAQEQAVRSLLFVGVPDSPIARPMIANEQQALQQHRVFFDDLFARKGYARYIVRVTAGARAPGAPADAESFVVLVNTDALRTALEKAGVVRRFGY